MGLIEKRVRQIFRDRAVTPEVHIPDQRKGDISSEGIFPNPAHPYDHDLSSSGLEIPGLSLLENIRPVPIELLPDDYIMSVADTLFDIKMSLDAIVFANRELKKLDTEAILLRPGALVLQGNSIEFWRSLFDEARLSGHRTVGAVVHYILAQGLPKPLKEASVRLLEDLRADYERQVGAR